MRLTHSLSQSHNKKVQEDNAWLKLCLDIPRHFWCQPITVTLREKFQCFLKIVFDTGIYLKWYLPRKVCLSDCTGGVPSPYLPLSAWSHFNFSSFTIHHSKTMYLGLKLLHKKDMKDFFSLKYKGVTINRIRPKLAQVRYL